jgi:hypothetical protein
MRSILITMLLLSFASANAETITIDFESLEQSENYSFESYSEDGFLFTVQNSLLAVRGTNDVWYAGSTALFNAFGGRETVFTKGGESFDLISIDLSEIEIPLGSSTVTFSRDGGHSQTFVTDGPFGFETFFFDSGFLGATSVSWVSEFATPVPQIDNIVINVVPIPAAIWLFGSALAGLGWLRRKQTV